MTIDSVYIPETHANGNGQTEYPFQFETISKMFVKVYEVTSSTRTLLAEYTDYTVEMPLNRDPIFYRGDIILNDPLPEGSWLEIQRKTNISTGFDPAPLMPFKPNELEYVMDKVTMIQQEIEGHMCDCRGEKWPPPGIPPDEEPEIPPPGTGGLVVSPN